MWVAWTPEQGACASQPPSLSAQGPVTCRCLRSASAMPGAFEEHVNISGVPEFSTHFNQSLLSLYFPLWPVYINFFFTICLVRSS